jgi:hypothetical protein
MQLATFEQLFNFRTNCLCGNPLSIVFNHGIHMDDDYTVIKPMSAYKLVKGGDQVAFPCCLESRLSPSGQVYFLILANLKDPSCSIKSEYYETGGVSTVTEYSTSPDDFVKRHFTQQLQTGFNINLRLQCSHHSSCQYRYQLSTGPIIFDMDMMQLKPITLISEYFILNGMRMKYYFKTDFATETTSITYNMPMPPYILGTQQVIQMNSEKFLRYPLEHEFLLNKLKTLLLFS